MDLRQHLEEEQKRDFDLLKKLEDKRHYEDNPRLEGKWDAEIEQIKQRIRKREADLEFFENKDQEFNHRQPQQDAERKYRTELEKIIYEDYGDNNRQIHPISRQNLDELQKKLGISLEIATAIENEVRQVCLHYEEKVQKYKQILADTFERGDLLDNKVRKKLKHSQNVLGLEDGTIALAYSSFGNELCNQGKLQEAISFFKEAIYICPDSAEAYLGLGVVLYKQGKQKEAIENITLAKKLFENHKKTEKAQQTEQFLLQKGEFNNILPNFIKRLLP